MKEIQEQTSTAIREVDELEALDKVMRKKLVTVSKDFNNYSEENIKDAYEKASEIRVRYFTKQQEEKNLREKEQIWSMPYVSARHIKKCRDAY